MSHNASTTASTIEKNQEYVMSEEEFWTDPKDPYYQQIAASAGPDVYPSNNPGPTKEDGSVNFECHCVGHLVASPCGYEFREALNCQKMGGEDECAKELIEFAKCVNRTECFLQTKHEDSKS